MTIFQTMIQRIQAGFSAPRRRAAAGRHSLVTAGLECLEGRRVMSADGWLPGLINFETESNDTRATADSIAVTSVANPNADVVFTGGIRSTNDVDYYKFTLHKTSAVQLDAYKLNPSMQLSGDVDLKLEDSNGQELAISERLGGNSERINKELGPGTYFIKVYPYNYTGFGVSYQVRLQSTASATPAVPGTPSITGPSNTNDSTPTFTWTSASNATRYELWVNNKATGQKVIHERNVTETSFTPGPEMSAGTYAVWVRAWNGNTPGEWSARHDFTVASSDDPNGRNNTWPEATLIRNLDDGSTSGVKNDRLSVNDKTDFFSITWGRNRTHVGLRVTISVTEGNFADLRIKVYRLRNGQLSELGSLNEFRSGNSLTLSTNPMIVSPIDTGFIIQVTSATGSENLAYRIEA